MKIGVVVLLLHQRAAKVLLAAALVYLLTFEYCSLRYWRDPHSAFFDIRNVFEWKYSLVREHEARHFISLYNAPPLDDHLDEMRGRGDDPPLICTALATVKRDQDDYFEASVGSILSNLDPRERRALHLSVLFANTDPTLHPSWGQRWVTRLTDSSSSYNVSSDELHHLQELEKEHNFYEKGI